MYCQLSIYRLYYQRHLIPHTILRYFTSENTAEGLKKELEELNTLGYPMIEYLDDLRCIVENNILNINQDEHYLMDRYFKPIKHVLFRPKEDLFIEGPEKKVKDYHLHITYRISRHAYRKLKKDHLSVLALIY